jgi:hypothetical protein
MKWRWMPFLWTLVISAILLFVGWFGVQKFLIEQPYLKSVSQLNGLKSVDLAFTRQQKLVRIELQPEANLREVIQAVRAEAASHLGNTPIEIEVMNKTTYELEAWYSNALFDIAQAMETKRYSDIPTSLEKHRNQLKTLQVKAEIDQENVYLQFKLEEHRKYVILPRVSRNMEVWYEQTTS